MLRSTALSKTLRALFLGVALVSLMIACAGYALLREIRRPAGNSAETVDITVAPGDSTSAIGTKLRENGLIRQPLLFTMLVRSQGLDGKLQAGQFHLRQNMTLSQIISALQVSTKIEEVQVTLKEGLRLEEVAETIGKAGLTNVDEESFLDVARDGSRFKDHALLNTMPLTATLEGFLFPDTYRFAKTATVTDVIDIMLTRFDEQYRSFEKEITAADANGAPIDVYKIVTMASIVQREAAREGEMPKIAAVFWNRLRPEHQGETGNGKLQSDPTLQYALGKPGNWWPKLDTLTLDQINANTHPYNTRVHPGLPPGPISNPGLAALRAAARPDTSAPYLYFVASCTDPGAHNFATTNEEFQRFEQEYLACKG
jgi:UPF0755 protein